VRTELTLRLKRDTDTDGPAREIVDELIRLGGWMTHWESEPLCPFGCATFVFVDKTDGNRFLRAALRVPGVYRELHGREQQPDLTPSIMLDASDAPRSVANRSA
jgi:hypothetical protein